MLLDLLLWDAEVEVAAEEILALATTIDNPARRRKTVVVDAVADHADAADKY